MDDTGALVARGILGVEEDGGGVVGAGGLAGAIGVVIVFDAGDGVGVNEAGVRGIGLLGGETVERIVAKGRGVTGEVVALPEVAPLVVAESLELGGAGGGGKRAGEAAAEGIVLVAGDVAASVGLGDLVAGLVVGVAGGDESRVERREVEGGVGKGGGLVEVLADLDEAAEGVVAVAGDLALLVGDGDALAEDVVGGARLGGGVLVGGRQEGAHGATVAIVTGGGEVAPRIGDGANLAGIVVVVGGDEVPGGEVLEEELAAAGVYRAIKIINGFCGGG